MTDLALEWIIDNAEADLVLDGAGLRTGDALRTAIIISLFTDRRAEADDQLPADNGDRRGWWADFSAEVEGDRIGSRLWLLAREKRRPAVLERAREYAREALQWLVDDGVAAAITVEPSFVGDSGFGFAVTVERPGGPARQRYDFVWEGI